MNPISASMLTRRIKVQSPTLLKDSVGAPCKAWTDLKTVWADIQPLSGKEAVIANRLSSEITHQITIRHQEIFDNPQQVAQMRVLYKSRIFNIHSALNEEEKRTQIILLVSEGFNDG